jgi:putative PIN family toxin of toxin-antitoxin system
MIFVLDCNVLISSAINDGICRRIIKDILINYKVAISLEITEEYLKVMNRKKLKKYIDYNMKQLHLICENAELVKKSNIKFILPDNDDVKYLQTAKAAKANYIVTGNLKDLPEGEYEDIKIINPRAYEDLLLLRK